MTVWNPRDPPQQAAIPIDRKKRRCKPLRESALRLECGSGKKPMKKVLIALVPSVLWMPTVLAAAPGEVTVPIHRFIDGFNTGNVKSAYAAYASGNITIVDEFSPYRWLGPRAPQAWAADYSKHALALGITDGVVKYGAPKRTEIEGDLAYVIVPTAYTYKERGQPCAEDGEMTFVLRAGADGWKISSWTWSGAKPHPAE
jgi:hypothetical protein